MPQHCSAAETKSEQPYTVMIVDDERRTRENLIRILSGRDDCRVVCSASDGAQGLALARRHRPQIVLSDIKMPVMDGIQFAFALKELAPAAVLLFLTGYSDKELLLSAIKLGVCDYIEKPIVLEELQSAVDRAIAKLRLEKDGNAGRARKPGTLKVWREEIESKLIIDLAENRYEPQALLERLRRIELKIPVYSPYYAVVLRAAAGAEASAELPETVLRTVKMKCTEYGVEGITGLYSPHYIVLLVHCNEFSELDTLYEILGETEQALEPSAPSCALYGGIGRRVSNLADIRVSFLDAVNLCDTQAYLEREPVEVFSAQEDKSAPPAPKITDPSQFEEAIAYYTARGQFPLADMKTYFAETIYRLLDSKSLTAPAFGTVYSRVYQTGSLRELRQLLAELFPQTTAPAESEPHYLVDNVHHIIRNHYSDPSLSTAWLAEKLEVSKSYLSNLYKAKTGQTLSHSINVFRTEKAKLLLRGSALKIYEIAERCGYADENYFIRVFKKITGVTPLKYREGRRR